MKKTIINQLIPNEKLLCGSLASSPTTTSAPSRHRQPAARHRLCTAGVQCRPEPRPCPRVAAAHLTPSLAFVTARCQGAPARCRCAAAGGGAVGTLGADQGERLLVPCACSFLCARRAGRRPRALSPLPSAPCVHTRCGSAGARALPRAHALVLLGNNASSHPAPSCCHLRQRRVARAQAQGEPAAKAQPAKTEPAPAAAQPATHCVWASGSAQRLQAAVGGCSGAGVQRGRDVCAECEHAGVFVQPGVDGWELRGCSISSS